MEVELKDQEGEKKKILKPTLRTVRILKPIEKEHINCFAPVDFHGNRRWEKVSENLFEHDFKKHRPFFKENYQYDQSENFPFQFKTVQEPEDDSVEKFD